MLIITYYKLWMFAQMVKRISSNLYIDNFRMEELFFIYKKMAFTLYFYNMVFLTFRLFRLLEEIMHEHENKTLIFTETKRRADDLSRRMKREGYVYSLYIVLLESCIRFRNVICILILLLRWQAMCIHGDKSQPERDFVLSGKYESK